MLIIEKGFELQEPTKLEVFRPQDTKFCKTLCDFSGAHYYILQSMCNVMILISQDAAAPPPTEECGSPQWATDDYCDDENNNAGCNYDGGACCPPHADGWDIFCTTCECKENKPTTPATTKPTTVTTTETTTSTTKPDEG